MDRPPANWQEVINAPEIPEDLEDFFCEGVWYQRAPTDPRGRFVIIIFKVDMGDGTFKFYLSHDTATSLHAAGFREICDRPILPLQVQGFEGVVYDYRGTKSYADWYFSEKGRFLFRPGSVKDLHLVLLFFAQDKNWRPFHHSYMHDPDPCTAVKQIIHFSVAGITREIMGQNLIVKSEEAYTTQEIEFIRVLIGLSVLQPDFATYEFYQNFIKFHMTGFNQSLNYQISFESFMRKFDYKNYFEFALTPSPKFKIVIQHYLFSLNNLNGDYVRHALKKYQKISYFNIIFRFLNLPQKRLVHFDDYLSGEIEHYMKTYKQLSTQLGNLLPYADLLVMNSETNICQWKALAAVAYLNYLHTYPEMYAQFYNSLVVPVHKMVLNLLPKLEVISNNIVDEKYTSFDQVTESHFHMKAIEWKPWDFECTMYMFYQLKNLFKPNHNWSLGF